MELSEDGQTVWVKASDVSPVMQMKIQFQIKDAKGANLEMQLFNTINETGPKRKL